MNKKFNNLCVASFCLVVLATSISILPAQAQQIITNGYTNTSLSTSGNVTQVTTTTIKGNNAFNSFSKFNVDKGNVVNLIVPGTTVNLINIIKDETSYINGTLNSLKNGNIGGNVFLVNPNGIVVGKTGVVNVGSLTNITPTKEFVDNFFDAPGRPNDKSVNALLNGKVPINPSATILIKGNINEVNKPTNNKVNMADIVNLQDMPEKNEIVILLKPGDLVSDATPCPPIPRLETDKQKIVTTGPIKPNDLVSGGLPVPPIPIKTIDSQKIVTTGHIKPNDLVSGGMPIPPIPLKVKENQNTQNIGVIKPGDMLSGHIPLPPVPELSH